MLLKRINFFLILCIFIFKCTVLLSCDRNVNNTDLLSKSDFFYKSDLLNKNNIYCYNENVFKLPDFMDMARETSWESLSNIILNEKYEIYFCSKDDPAFHIGYNFAVFDLKYKSMYIKNHVFLKKRIIKDGITETKNSFMNDEVLKYWSKFYYNNYKKDESLTSDIPILENSMINIISGVKERVACCDDIYMNYPTRYLTLYDLCSVKKGDDIKEVERLLGDPDFIINTKTFMSYCYYYYLKVEDEPVILRRLIIDFNDNKIIININYIF